MPIDVRDYHPFDERAWLRCRVLSFLNTAYFDDVQTVKKRPAVGAELVAVHDSAIVGLLDLSAEGTLATIDTIAVHPDHQRRGIATALFERARSRAAALGATNIDAWTRDDEPALRWYRARGFAESGHYLHIYADYYTSPAEPDAAVRKRPGLFPMKVLLHASLEHEDDARTTFRRVHICRRFAQPLSE